MLKRYLYLMLIALFHNSFALHFELKEAKQLKKNIIYSVYNSSEIPLQAHIVKIPIDRIDIKLIPALGQREETSSIAKRSDAFIAINGSNYRRGGKYNGNRVNLFYSNNQILSDLGLARGSFAWNGKSKTAVIDTVYLKTRFQINSVSYPVDQVNQPRDKGQSVLYTDVADISLLAHHPGTNLTANNQGTIVDISDCLPHQIPTGGYVYQIENNKNLAIKKGNKISVSFELQSCSSNKTYTEYYFLFAGAGLLIKNEKIIVDHLYDEFSQGNAIVHCGDEVAADFHTTEVQQWLIELRHPRTALGITKNNELCIAVIDGRQNDSEGLTLKELALLMYQQGCVDVLNIGGGGCSTLCIEGEVKNNPSAQEERPVSEALCFFTY